LVGWLFGCLEEAGQPRRCLVEIIGIRMESMSRDVKVMLLVVFSCVKSYTNSHVIPNKH
jgi:hypothetical protein